MKTYLKYLPYILFLLALFLVYKAWFFPGLITAGDFWPSFTSMYHERTILLYAWDPVFGNGYGANTIPFLWIYTNIGLFTTVFGIWLNMSWSTLERVGYLYPFLVLSVFSSTILYKYIFPKSTFFLLAPAIYTLNTYILMVIAGGQIIGIGMAYAILPLIVYFFLKALNNSTVPSALFLGCIIAAQAVFDIRVTYITYVLLGMLFLFIEKKSFIKAFLFSLAIPSLVVIFLHAYWVLPLLIQPRNPISELGDIYSTSEAVNFFSFATLENSISLLHPNWPTNLFGKVEFMKPEFLVLPIIAFLSIIFAVRKKTHENKLIIAFAFVALIAAFLAKGSKPPFGELYVFLFEYFPGMQMFRDPTKFYILVALCFTILIPFSVESLANFFKEKSKIFSFFFVSTIIVLFAFLIRHAFYPGLPGLFRATQIPDEYKKLEEMLIADKSFGRTLWIPTNQRFSYYSINHPVIPGYNLFNTQDIGKLSEILNKPGIEKMLEESSIKYVIVPYDSEREIYLKDRAYSEGLYKKTLENVSSSPYFKRIPEYEKIGVFESVLDPKELFWTDDQNVKIEYKTYNNSRYVVDVLSAREGDNLIFAQAYNAGWVAFVGGEAIKSEKYDRFNSFEFPKDGDYSIEVYYSPQTLLFYSSFLSIGTLIVIIGYLLYVKFVKRNNNER